METYPRLTEAALECMGDLVNPELESSIPMAVRSDLALRLGWIVEGLEAGYVIGPGRMVFLLDSLGVNSQLALAKRFIDIGNCSSLYADLCYPLLGPSFEVAALRCVRQWVINWRGNVLGFQLHDYPAVADVPRHLSAMIEMVELDLEWGGPESDVSYRDLYPLPVELIHELGFARQAARRYFISKGTAISVLVDEGHLRHDGVYHSSYLGGPIRQLFIQLGYPMATGTPVRYIPRFPNRFVGGGPLATEALRLAGE